MSAPASAFLPLSLLVLGASCRSGPELGYPQAKVGSPYSAFLEASGLTPVSASSQGGIHTYRFLIQGLARRPASPSDPIAFAEPGAPAPLPAQAGSNVHDWAPRPTPPGTPVSPGLRPEVHPQLLEWTLQVDSSGIIRSISHRRVDP